MKFVGKNPKECLNKLMSGKYKKYRDANVTMEVPSDFYDGVCQEIDKNVADLNKQVEAAKRQGKMAVAKQKQAQIDDLKRTRQNLKKSRVSQSDAMEARKNPRLSTAKDIHRLSMMPASMLLNTELVSAELSVDCKMPFVYCKAKKARQKLFEIRL